MRLWGILVLLGLLAACSGPQGSSSEVERTQEKGVNAVGESENFQEINLPVNFVAPLCSQIIGSPDFDQIFIRASQTEIFKCNNTESHVESSLFYGIVKNLNIKPGDDDLVVTHCQCLARCEVLGDMIRFSFEGSIPEKYLLACSELDETDATDDNPFTEMISALLSPEAPNGVELKMLLQEENGQMVESEFEQNRFRDRLLRRLQKKGKPVVRVKPKKEKEESSDSVTEDEEVEEVEEAVEEEEGENEVVVDKPFEFKRPAFKSFTYFGDIPACYTRNGSDNGHDFSVGRIREIFEGFYDVRLSYKGTIFAPLKGPFSARNFETNQKSLLVDYEEGRGLQITSHGKKLSYQGEVTFEAVTLPEEGVDEIPEEAWKKFTIFVEVVPVWPTKDYYCAGEFPLDKIENTAICPVGMNPEEPKKLIDHTVAAPLDLSEAETELAAKIIEMVSAYKQHKKLPEDSLRHITDERLARQEKNRAGFLWCPCR